MTRPAIRDEPEAAAEIEAALLESPRAKLPRAALRRAGFAGTIPRRVVSEIGRD